MIDHKEEVSAKKKKQKQKQKKHVPPILQLCLQGYSQWASPHRCDGYKNK